MSLQPAVNRRTLLRGSAALAASSLPLATRAAATCRAHSNWVPSPSLVEALPSLMEVGRVPGVGMAVAADGKLVWRRSFGAANAASGKPVTDSTLFEAASMTKPAFAYVVMKLVDKGKLELDRPLVDYRRPDYLGADPRLDRITVRDVLRHSTGLPNWSDGLLKTIAAPASGYTYSGEGIVWLQLIVEKVTGEAIGAGMERMLLGPAGMASSTMGWDARVAREAAYGHRESDVGTIELAEQPTRALGNALLPIAQRWNNPIAQWTYEDQVRAMREAVPATSPMPHELLVNAAGGLMTTPSDYVRFMLLMMDGRRSQTWEISERSRRAMLSHQLDTGGRTFYRGLGWQREDPLDMTIFEHSGSNYGIFHSLAVGDARSGNAIAIFTNGANGAALAKRIVRETVGIELLKFLA